MLKSSWERGMVRPSKRAALLKRSDPRVIGADNEVNGFMARATAWMESMPGKTARALCPVCQEPMPPDETECENCGAFVIDEAVVRLCRALGIPREKALALFEKGFRHPTQLKDRSVDDVLERGENGLLFLCTNCGGFVATGDPKCPRCGAEFEMGPEEAAPEK